LWSLQDPFKALVKWLPFVVCYFIPRGRGFFFSSLSLFLGASFFGCFQPCWFFQMPLPSFCFVGALYVAWVLFNAGLFSVRTLFFLASGGSLRFDQYRHFAIL
jgi:hypothetical protein